MPAVFNVTLKDFVPLTSAALAGNVAFASDEAMATVSLVLMTFQKVSTALTVTLKAVPAVCPLDVPVLPVAVPGAAVSPGTSICNFVNAAGLTTILLEVTLANPDALKVIEIVAATLCERFVNATTPPTAVILVVPCSEP